MPKARTPAFADPWRGFSLLALAHLGASTVGSSFQPLMRQSSPKTAMPHETKCLDTTRDLRPVSTDRQGVTALSTAFRTFALNTANRRDNVRVVDLWAWQEVSHEPAFTP